MTLSYYPKNARMLSNQSGLYRFRQLFICFVLFIAVLPKTKAANQQYVQRPKQHNVNQDDEKSSNVNSVVASSIEVSIGVDNSESEQNQAQQNESQIAAQQLLAEQQLLLVPQVAEPANVEQQQQIAAQLAQQQQNQQYVSANAAQQAQLALLAQQQQALLAQQNESEIAAQQHKQKKKEKTTFKKILSFVDQHKGKIALGLGVCAIGIGTYLYATRGAASAVKDTLTNTGTSTITNVAQINVPQTNVTQNITQNAPAALETFKDIAVDGSMNGDQALSKEIGKLFKSLSNKSAKEVAGKVVNNVISTPVPKIDLAACCPEHTTLNAAGDLISTSKLSIFTDWVSSNSTKLIDKFKTLTWKQTVKLGATVFSIPLGVRALYKWIFKKESVVNIIKDTASTAQGPITGAAVASSTLPATAAALGPLGAIVFGAGAIFAPFVGRKILKSVTVRTEEITEKDEKGEPLKDENGKDKKIKIKINAHEAIKRGVADFICDAFGAKRIDHNKKYSKGGGGGGGNNGNNPENNNNDNNNNNNNNNNNDNNNNKKKGIMGKFKNFYNNAKTALNPRTYIQSFALFMGEFVANLVADLFGLCIWFVIVFVVIRLINKYDLWAKFCDACGSPLVDLKEAKKEFKENVAAAIKEKYNEIKGNSVQTQQQEISQEDIDKFIQESLFLHIVYQTNQVDRISDWVDQIISFCVQKANYYNRHKAYKMTWKETIKQKVQLGGVMQTANNWFNEFLKE